MTSDREPPTRRIPPQQPEGQPPGEVRETEYVTDDPAAREAELHDRVRSLQTALALVGVLAAAALGIALWTLLSDDEGGDGRGASPERVSRLQDRVDTLEDRVDERATKNSVSDVRSDVESLQEEVEQAASDDAGAEAQQAVESLSSDVSELQQQVEELAQQQEQDAAQDRQQETTP